MNPDTRPPGITGIVLGTTGSQVAVAMAIAIFPVIAPQLATRLDVDASLVGYQMSLLFGSAMAVSPTVGTAVLRWGACRTMQLALGMCVMGMCLALVGNLYFIALSSVLVGASAALVAAGAAHLLFRFTAPQRLNLLFSIKQTGVPLGWATIALLAPSITLGMGWRWSLVAVILYGIGMVIVLQRMRPLWDDDRDPAARMQGQILMGVRLLWRYPAMRHLAFASFFFSFVQLCLGTFTVTLLVKEAGYSLIEAGFMFALVQIAGMSGRLMLGWIADVTGRSIRILGVTDLVVAACCIITAFINSAWPPALLALHYIVFGAMVYGWNGVLHAQIARLSPKGMVSTATGGIMVWIFAGTLVGPALFAAGYRYIGSYTASFGALAVAALAGWILLRAARSADRQPGNVTA
ncbi:MAG: MFS transporter [Burkholderiales bacterium]|nr:MFS transporter [Burkholderiales bacterium]